MIRLLRICGAIVWLAALASGWAGTAATIDPAVLETLGKPIGVPQIYPTELFPEREGIRPIFYEGAPFQGKPTRVFAWLGLPPGEGKVPGVVLVHGGGGTAMREWVKLWVDRGYAAIAMDTGGRVPQLDDTFRVKGTLHEWAGPSEKGNGFAESNSPIGDQWMFHAISAIMGAERILANEPRVDAQRIGITGISWGGVMTELAASLNPNFKCAAPVYGCGYLGEDSYWQTKRFPEIDSALVARWLQLWDPSQYLGALDRPALFANGATDPYFPTVVWMKTTQLPKGPVTRSLRVGLNHGHPPHGDPPEVTVFMDSVLKGGAPLPVILNQEVQGHDASMTYQSAQPPVSANLFYTLDSGEWKSRKWQQLPVTAVEGKVSAIIPENFTAGYFGLEMGDKVRVSGPLIVR